MRKAWGTFANGCYQQSSSEAATTLTQTHTLSAWLHVKSYTAGHSLPTLAAPVGLYS